MTWLKTTIGDVLPFKYGRGLPERERSGSGQFRVVGSGGVAGSHSFALTSGPSVVIGRKGSIGAVYYFAEPVWPIDTTFYVQGSASVDARFAYYLLGQLPLDKMNSDSAVPGLNRAHAESIEIELPPIVQQREIAATLGALDDKIDSNQDFAASTLELIRAGVEGSITADSEKIPVSGLAEFVNGGAYTKGATGAGRMVIRIAELNSGPGDSTVYTDLEVPDNRMARPGDILMAWSGSLGVHRWSRDEAIINQHIFKVLPYDYPEWLVYDRIQTAMPTFRAIARDKATTMGHIQRRHLIETVISLPSRTATDELDRVFGPLWQRLLVAERESITLAKLRDALIPELLSGRTRTPSGLDE
ncbi:hypothetical protein GCM10022286_10180 [Gryllotalpicola daejeonensis]|uniref:Type I restriction modification DNA specificity domain-containing protein n=1 Tax=Gryllotalpicola daejeonensis TaxID=993087 RepID=A0ABP7ZHH0_9MICO